MATKVYKAKTSVDKSVEEKYKEALATKNTAGGNADGKVQVKTTTGTPYRSAAEVTYVDSNTYKAVHPQYYDANGNTNAGSKRININTGGKPVTVEAGKKSTGKFSLPELSTGKLEFDPNTGMLAYTHKDKELTLTDVRNALKAAPRGTKMYATEIGKKYLEQQKNGVKDTTDYVSIEDYKALLKDYDEQVKAAQKEADRKKNLDAAAIRKRLDEIDIQLSTMYKDGGYNVGAKGQKKADIESYQTRNDIINQLRMERQSLLTDLQYAEAIKTENTYKALANNADFVTKADEGKRLFESGAMLPEFEQLRKKEIEETGGTVNMNKAFNYWQGPELSKYTEDEKNTFYYLYATDKDEAEKYWQYINRKHAEEEEQRKIKEAYDWAVSLGDNNIVPTAIAYGTGLIQGLDYIGDALDYAAYGRMRPSFDLTDINETMQSAALANIDARFTIAGKEIDANSAVRFLYGTGLSILNSRTLVGALGKYASIPMALSSASSATKSALAKGATDQQAITIGFWNGVAEAAFEEISIEHLLNAPNYATATKKELIRFALEQAAVEASEEVNTTLANTISEAIVMGNLSDYNVSYNEYRAKGLTMEEARKKAQADWLSGIILDALGGFISGGVMGGVPTAFEIATRSGANQQLKQQAKYLVDTMAADEKSEENFRKVLEEGLKADEGSKTRVLADEIANKLNAEETVSKESYYALTESIIQDGNLEDIRSGMKYVQAVTGENMEQEVSPASVAALDKVQSGQLLTDEEKATLDSDPVAQRYYEATTGREYKTGEAMTQERYNEVLGIKNEEKKTGPVEMGTADELREDYSEQYGKELAGLMANDILEGKQEIASFANSYNEVYELAKAGAPLENIQKAMKGSVLTPYQVQRAYTFGRGKRAFAQQQYQNNAGKARAKNPNAGRVTVQSGLTLDQLRSAYGRKFAEATGRKQSEAYKLWDQNIRAIQELAKILQYEIRLTDEGVETNKNGRRVFAGANGQFGSAEPGVIEVSVTAGMVFEDDMGNLANHVMVQTLAHELVHAGRFWAKKDFDALQNLVFKYIDKNGGNIRDLVDEQMLIAKENGNPISRDVAAEEVVAQAMTDMLLDERVVNDMAEQLANENPSLIEKIVKAIDNFIAKIKAFMKGNSYKEAQLAKVDVDGMLQYAEDLRKAFADMTVAASRNMQAAKEADAMQENETEDLKFSRRDFGTTEYNGKKSVVKRGKTVYNEGRTIAMQWAYHPDTKIGDIRTVLLNGKYSVVQATKIDDGYVVIKNYSEKEYDQYYAHGMANRVYGSSDGQRLSDRGRGTYFGSIRNEREYAKVSGISDRIEGRNGFASRSLERSGENTASGEGNGTVSYQYRNVSEINADIKKNNEERLALQKEQTELRNQYNSLNNSEELKDIIERMPKNSAGDDAIQKWVNEYKAWEDRTQFAKIKERLDAVSENLSKLNKQFDALYDEREETQERQDIEKSGLPENEYFVKKAVSEYGHTPYFYDAGYILPNGRLLNFSGDKGKHYGSRGLDHRNIGSIFANTSDSSAMLRFMSYGNVRIMDETPGVDILKSTEPTKEQYAEIRKHIEASRSREYYSVDFTDERGNTIGSLEYEGRVSANKVIADIKEFFETGKVPEQNSEMDINRFLYQQRDADYMAAVNAGDMETAQRMVEERAKEAGYTVKAYHGTISFGFTKPDVKHGDRQLSMFATSAVNTAQSYSHGYGVKKINSIDPKYYYPEQDFDYDMENAIDDAASILPDDISFPFRYTFARYEEKIMEALYDDNLYTTLYDIANDEWNRDAYTSDRLYNGFYDWLDTEEGKIFEDYAENISNKITPLYKKFQDYLDMADESDLDEYAKDYGIYDLFINTDGFLEIDANGENWNSIVLDGKIVSTRDIEKKFAGQYPGVIIHNVLDDGGLGDENIDVETSDVYIMYHPEQQAKSADPITYDDSGKVIPLSERFNDGNEDIRYQSRETDGYVDSWSKREKVVASLEKKLSKKYPDVEGIAFSDIDISHGMGSSATFYINFTVNDGDDAFTIRYSGHPGGHGYADPNYYIWNSDIHSAKELDEAIDNIVAEYRRDNENLMNHQYRSSSMPSDIDILIEASEDVKNNKAGNFSQKEINALNTVYDRLHKIKSLREKRAEYREKLNKAMAKENPDRIEVNDLSAYVRAYSSQITDQENYVLKLAGENVPAAKSVLKTSRQNAVSTAAKAERERGNERLKALRKMRDEKVASAIKDEREKKNALATALRKMRDEKVAEAEARGRERLREYREDRNEKAMKDKYKASIARRTKTLTDWMLKNSDKEHVPEILKESVGELLTSIDQSSPAPYTTKRDVRLADALTKLRDELAKQRNLHSDSENENNSSNLADYYFDLPVEVYKRLSALVNKVDAASRNAEGGYTINDMSGADLKELDATLKVVSKCIRDMNKLYANGRFQGVAEAAEDTIRYLASFGQYSGNKSKTVETVTNALEWAEATPFYAFKRFGSAGMSIFSGLQDGWDKLAFNIDAIKDFKKSAYTDKEVNDWSNNVLSIELEDGYKVQMTTAQLMALYCLSKREQAKKHIFGGGIRVGDIRTDSKGKSEVVYQTEAHNWTLEDLQNAFKNLTERQIEVAEKLQKYMETKGSAWGNYVSMMRYGYEAFGEENYFPIETDNNTRAAIDETAKANELFRLLNISATKSLVEHAENALVVRDIFDVFAAHMSDMAKYNALAMPILDMMKWYNYNNKSVKNENGAFNVQSTQTSIEKAFGPKARNYVVTFVKDINGTREGGRDTDIVSSLVSNFKVAAVGANLRVALLQPTAYTRAMAVIDPKYLARAAVMRSAYKEAEENSGIALWKSMGFYDTNIARGVREQIKGGGKLGDKIREKSMTLAEWGDKLTWGKLWNACKLEQQDKGYTGDELIEKTKERFREVVYATQVVDSTMTRSELMRSNNMFWKMATSFQAEPTLSYNILMDAAESVRLDMMKGMTAKNAVTKNFKRLAIAGGTYVVSAFATAVFESIADALRDDDDDEFLNKWLESMFGASDDGIIDRIYGSNLFGDLSLLNKLPLARDAISLIQGYSVSRTDTEVVAAFVDAVKPLLELYRLKTGKQEKATETTWYGNMQPYAYAYRVAKALSYATGLPLSDATRELVTVWNNTVGLIDPDLKARQYQGKYDRMVSAFDGNDTSKLKSEVNKLLDAGIEKSTIKSKITTTYKEEYISANETRRAEIRKAMAATGIYKSVDDVIKLCNGWIKNK